jgi:hypothetical protein
MFILVNKETSKKGSFHATHEEAMQKIQKLGSIGEKFKIVDIGDTPYESFQVSSE